ncbi:MAG: ABC transporter ATP-binding protein [Holophagales bacterium]|nr:MAG: ABC transporter ATP-binding protein [Holophagales bacterium]
MSAAIPGGHDAIAFAGVSKFYGEVLGVNKVDLEIQSGITALVGPNGSGKTTLMNLATGLLRPTRGLVRVLGLTTDEPERLFRAVGYCTQVDAFPRGATGLEFVRFFLRLHGFVAAEAERLAWQAIEKVGLTEAAERRVAGYSKGMRQRIKLAQAIAHDPRVLVLDEPLNGLDPLARSELLALLRELAAAGRHVVVSSHVLHEVDLIADRVVLIHGGYLVASGEVSGMRGEMAPEHPAQVRLRSGRGAELAARLFSRGVVVEARLEDDGVVVRTRDADALALAVARLVVEEGIEVEGVAPLDDDVESVYRYLIGSQGGANV